MSGVIIPSIEISGINMEKCYFNPGCALSVYKRDAAGKILNMLN